MKKHTKPLVKQQTKIGLLKSVITKTIASHQYKEQKVYKPVTRLQNLIYTSHEKESSEKFLLMFWLAIHMESLDIAKLLLEKSDILMRIVVNILKIAKIKKIEIEKSVVQNLSRRNSKHIQSRPSKTIIEVSHIPSLPHSPLIQNNKTDANGINKFNPNAPRLKSSFYKKNGITPESGFLNTKKNQPGFFTESISNRELKGIQKQSSTKLHTPGGGQKHFLRIKNFLKTSIGKTFNTQVLKIALNECEDRIASVISAYYDVVLDDEMIQCAICTNQLQIVDQSTMQSDYLSYGLLFRKMMKVSRLEAEEIISQMVLFWGIESGGDESILQSLLENDLEELAIKAAYSYVDEATIQLFKFLIKRQKKQFLAYSMNKEIFSQKILNSEEIVEFLMKRLHLLLQEIEKITLEDYKMNILTRCHNPLLTVVLCAEYLIRIGSSYKLLKHKTTMLQKKLIKLGQQLIVNLDTDNIHKIMLDEDMKYRSVLTAIISNNFQELTQNEKIDTFLNEIWHGQQYYECNGTLQDFSVMYHIFQSQADMIQSQQYSFWRLFTNNFVYFGDKQRFFWNSKTRMKSIFFIAFKDFICSLLVVVLFQYINYDYYTSLNHTKSQQFLTPDQVEENVNSYQMKSKIGLVMVILILIHIFQRMIFKTYYRLPQNHQVWFYTDIMIFISNITGIIFMTQITADDIINEKSKQKYDYTVVIITTITWFRFFNFFLLSTRMAKLVVTLYQMIIDTLSFTALLILVLIISATAFTTRFSQVNENFQDLWHSLRYLFDCMVSNYEFEDYGIYQRSFSIFIMIFLTITNIFFLNFLVAIIDSIYQYMLKDGEFQAKKYRFYFYNSKMLAFEMSTDDLDSMIIHPPPYNVLSLVLILLIPFKNTRKKLSMKINSLVYWIDNIILAFLLLTIELIQLPFCYLKILGQLFMKLFDQKLWLVTCVVFWIAFGPFCLFSYIVIDLRNQFRLFKSNSEKDFEDEEPVQSDLIQSQSVKNLEKDHLRKLRIYNELKLVVKTMYKECLKRQKITRLHQIQKQKNKNASDANLQDISADVQSDNVDNKSLYEQSERKIGKMSNRRKRNRPHQNSSDLPFMSGTQKGYNEIDMEMPQKDDQDSKDKENQRNSYELNKNLIIEIWMKYHKKVKQDFKQHNGQKPAQKQSSNLIKIIGKRMYNKFLNEIKRKKTSLGFSKQRIHKISTKKIYSSETFKLSQKTLDNFSKGIQFTKSEKLAQNFIDKFTIYSMGDQQTLNLELMLYSLPKKITQKNVNQVEMINFGIIQKSIIQFQYSTIEELFLFYDIRSRKRLGYLQSTSENNSDTLEEILEIFQEVKKRFVKAAKFAKKVGFNIKQIDDEAEESSSSSSHVFSD
eukprot:403337919